MNDEDARIEAVLARYRPAGPPAGLRDRVFGLVEPRPRRFAPIGWSAVAAMLVLGLGLHWATQRVLRPMAAALHEPSTTWTAEADEAVKLLNGDGSGRQYLVMALAADDTRTRQLRAQALPPGLLRDIR